MANFEVIVCYITHIPNGTTVLGNVNQMRKIEWTKKILFFKLVILLKIGEMGTSKRIKNKCNWFISFGHPPALMFAKSEEKVTTLFIILLIFLTTVTEHPSLRPLCKHSFYIVVKLRYRRLLSSRMGYLRSFSKVNGNIFSWPIHEPDHVLEIVTLAFSQ